MVIQVDHSKAASFSELDSEHGGVDGAGTAGPGLSPRRARDLPRGVMHLVGSIAAISLEACITVCGWLARVFGLSLTTESRMKDASAAQWGVTMMDGWYLADTLSTEYSKDAVLAEKSKAMEGSNVFLEPGRGDDGPRVAAETWIAEPLRNAVSEHSDTDRIRPSG